MITPVVALILIGIMFILGILIGYALGRGAGKERTRSLLSYMGNKMEQLRADSKIKVIRRDIAKQYRDTTRADELTKELSGEAMVFFEVQRSIRDWCQSNNEKDPCAL